jgi:hypothetical protein
MCPVFTNFLRRNHRHFPTRSNSHIRVSLQPDTLSRGSRQRLCRSDTTMSCLHQRLQQPSTHRDESNSAMICSSSSTWRRQQQQHETTPRAKAHRRTALLNWSMKAFRLLSMSYCLRVRSTSCSARAYEPEVRGTVRHIQKRCRCDWQA